MDSKVNKSYLELGLPDFLHESITKVQACWEVKDRGEVSLHWDIWWCNLNADINGLEVNGYLSSEQAWYLREKYLRIKKGEY